MPGQERHYRGTGLHDRHIRIEIDTAQAFNIQRHTHVDHVIHGNDMLRHDFSARHTGTAATL